MPMDAVVVTCPPLPPWVTEIVTRSPAVKLVTVPEPLHGLVLAVEVIVQVAMVDPAFFAKLNIQVLVDGRLSTKA